VSPVPVICAAGHGGEVKFHGQMEWQAGFESGQPVLDEQFVGPISAEDHDFADFAGLAGEIPGSMHFHRHHSGGFLHSSVIFACGKIRPDSVAAAEFVERQSGLQEQIDETLPGPGVV
jgi:hypothetical protein